MLLVALATCCCTVNTEQTQVYSTLSVSSLQNDTVFQAVRPSVHLTCCVFQVIGTIDGSGKIVLKDKNQALEDPVPVDLDLEKVLGDMPRKTYNFTRSQPQLQPHQLPQGIPTQSATRSAAHSWPDSFCHAVVHSLGALLLMIQSLPLLWDRFSL